MSWSYSGDPSNSDKDHVRYLIGATDEDDQLVMDEEIEQSLASNANDVTEAAVEVCYAIAAQFSRQADMEVGDYSEDLSQKASNYRQLAKDLKQQKSDEALSPAAGSISQSKKDNQESDSDRTEPTFKRDMHDF